MKRGLVKIRISASDRFSEVNKPIKMTASITLRGANDSLKPLFIALFHVASSNLMKFHILAPDGSFAVNNP